MDGGPQFHEFGLLLSGEGDDALEGGFGRLLTINLLQLQHSAQQMLAELYGWFSEGFDSVDLREAKALLEQLQVAGA